MAPGALSILAPFLRRKVKKYERLETEDPERRNQDATMEELHRINNKIEKLVNSMTKEDFEPATNPEEECIGCGTSRAVMQVSPCSHQVLCRLCFVKNIQQAVATRNLPLCCVLCKCKILRVKNNYMPANQNGRSSHHSAGLPKSVSGYEVSSGAGRLRHSGSSYSVTSVSSGGSGRSVRSTGNQLITHSITRKHRYGGSDQSLETEPTTPTTPGGGGGGAIPNSKSTPLLSEVNPSSLLVAMSQEDVRSQYSTRQVPKPSISMPEKLSDYQQSPPPQQQIPPPSYSQTMQQQQPPPQPHPQPPTHFLPGSRYRRHHQLTGKESQLARMKLKSPDLAETSFTMSTIEEEIEGVNVSLGGPEPQIVVTAAAATGPPEPSSHLATEEDMEPIQE